MLILAHKETKGFFWTQENKFMDKENFLFSFESGS